MRGATAVKTQTPYTLSLICAVHVPVALPFCEFTCVMIVSVSDGSVAGENECEGDSHGCEHHCNDTPFSYYCSCDPGYYVTSNRKNCSGMIYTLYQEHECRLYTHDIAPICHVQCITIMSDFLPLTNLFIFPPSPLCHSLPFSPLSRYQ